MSNTNRERSSTESDQTKQQQAHVNRSRHDATLLNQGPPALYSLNTERKYIDGTDGKIRQWTYGRRDGNKQNKVILVVGETGTGKNTIINTMINHLLGVKFEDQEFYQITQKDEKHQDQSQSQTSEIMVYEAFVEENPTSLTIIDTPGYGDTEGFEKDREISESLTRLFSDNDYGVQYIDAVCFVMKASENRLSGKELYIIHSVLSLFGRDIEENIMFLLTHSDGGPPTDALNAINTAGIPCRRNEDKPVHFLFNNRQKEKRDKKYEQMFRSSWEMGEESMNEFLKLLEEKNRKSVEMTLNVLKERRRLEACVSNLKQRIEEKESKSKELNQIQEALRQNRDKIKKCEKFEFTVTKTFKVKVPIVKEWPWNRKATCCSVCEENCHEWGCWWGNNLSRCEVMKDDHCTVCPRECHYSKHVREDKKYVTKTKDVIMTSDELKQEYESVMKESENKTKIEEKLMRDLKRIKKEKSKLLDEAYISITSLCKFTLKADSAFTLQHLDFLIPRLKEEGKEEWMKKLQDLRKAGEEKKNKGAVQYVWERTGKRMNDFFSGNK